MRLLSALPLLIAVMYSGMRSGIAQENNSNVLETAEAIRNVLAQQRQNLELQKSRLLQQQAVLKDEAKQLPLEARSLTGNLQYVCLVAAHYSQQTLTDKLKAQAIANQLKNLTQETKSIQVSVDTSLQNEVTVQKLQTVSDQLEKVKNQYTLLMRDETVPAEFRNLPQLMRMTADQFKTLSVSVDQVPEQLETLPLQIDALNKEIAIREVSDEALAADMKVVAAATDALRDQLRAKGLGDEFATKQVCYFWFYSRTTLPAEPQVLVSLTPDGMQKNLQRSRVAKIISTPREADVNVDGFRMGQTNMYPLLLVKGDHRITFSKPADGRASKGYSTVTKIVTITDNEPNVISAHLRKK